MGKDRGNLRDRGVHLYPKVEIMPSILVALLFAVASLSVSIALPAGSAAAATKTWIAVASPNEGTQENELDGVSCINATSCVAVGLYDYGTGTLIESWNGSAWSIVSSADEGDRPSLSSVSCVNSADCVAVGGYSPTGNKGSTLVESFNGTSWSIVPSPNRPGKNTLLSVSCTKKNFCMAVGTSGGAEPDPAYSSLVETWNGTDWSVGPHPAIGPLSSVSCVSSSECTAAGERKLAIWNGTSWAVKKTPLGSNAILRGVTCTSASNCVAVGQQIVTSSPDFRTAVLLWNGGKWSVSPSPNRGPDTGSGAIDNQLLSVSCTSSTRCVAVGDGGGSLVETWNGKSWKIASSQDLGDSVSNDLFGSACPTETSCQAVGAYDNGTTGQTLVETGSD